MTQTHQASLRWARLAVAVALGLLALKMVAAWLTGSSAVLSDAAESVVNVVAASVMLLAVRSAAEPADAEHPFGHGKAELLAAAFEGALLLAAAFIIAWNAIPAVFAPQPIEHLGWGTLLVGLTAVGNGVFGGLLIRTGGRTGSPALVADGRHLLTDAVSTVGVLAAVGLVELTGLVWIDPAAACLLALWIAYTGTSVVSGAARGLLDTRSPEYTERIAAALRQPPLEGLLEPHDLRVLDATSNVVVLLHARAPWMWTLERGRALQEQTEARIASVFTVPSEVQVQLEPCVPRCCRECAVKACERRSEAFTALAPFEPRQISAPHPE
ncbi:MAG: cation diffusion facilitator family transporter [Nannocystales bacterium]